MKEWEIIADNLHKAGWSLGWVSAVDSKGQTVWIVDARRNAFRRRGARPESRSFALAKAGSDNLF
jgi:hypothetical protein